MKTSRYHICTIILIFHLGLIAQAMSSFLFCIYNCFHFPCPEFFYKFPKIVYGKQVGTISQLTVCTTIDRLYLEWFVVIALLERRRRKPGAQLLRLRLYWWQPTIFSLFSLNVSVTRFRYLLCNL